MSRPVNHNRHGKAHPTRESRAQPTLWGLHAVRAAWENPKRHIRDALFTPQAMEALSEALRDKSLKRPQPRVADAMAFRNLFPGGEAVHQGAVLWGEALAQPDLEDWLKTAPTRAVILDHVTDPHNVGAIMRSACAFGFQAVIMQDRHAPPITGTLAKTACGAIEHIPLITVTNIARAIDALKEEQFFAVGLAEEESVPFTKLPRYDRLALVLGNEGEGLRDGVRKACDICVALPTTGAIRSLNVSAAASAAMMGVAGG